MSAALLFAQPFFQLGTIDNPVVGAKLSVFQTGTSTPVTVYHNSGLSSPWATNALVTNAAGQIGPIYVSPTPSLKVQVVYADNTQVPGFPIDPWTPYTLTA